MKMQYLIGGYGILENFKMYFNIKRSEMGKQPPVMIIYQNSLNQQKGTMTKVTCNLWYLVNFVIPYRKFLL